MIEKVLMRDGRRIEFSEEVVEECRVNLSPPAYSSTSFIVTDKTSGFVLPNFSGIIEPGTKLRVYRESNDLDPVGIQVADKPIYIVVRDGYRFVDGD